MARSLGRKPIAFDQRTGRKIRYDELVEDGEIPGLRVKRGTEDQEHPQKRLRRVGPDRQALWRPAPEVTKDPVTVNIGYEALDVDALHLPRPGPPQLLLYIGSFQIEFSEPAPAGFADFSSSIITWDSHNFTWDQSF
jgi:hypothetical protein